MVAITPEETPVMISRASVPPIAAGTTGHGFSISFSWRLNGWKPIYPTGSGFLLTGLSGRGLVNWQGSV